MTYKYNHGHDMAFPIAKTGPNDSVQYGLTKRELIAAMAMQGMLSTGNCSVASPSQLPELYKQVAEYATAQADALIAALSPEK